MESELIYLDYNATTPLDREVYMKICFSLKEDWGNPSSKSVYGKQAKKQVTLSRCQVAELIGVSPENVVFTSGGTESNNMVIYSSIKYYKRIAGISRKPHIVTSTIEHDATIRLLDNLQEEGEIDLTTISKFTTEKLAKSIQENTCLITLMMANNETGVIFPIQEVGRYLQSLNEQRKGEKLPRILFHTDAAQTIGKMQVNLKELLVDYISVVGHKFYGPRIGAVCRSDTAPLLPLFFGGGQEFNLRPGTENTAMISGLGMACEVANKNLLQYNEWMTEMRDYLEEKIKENLGDRVKVNFEDAKERLPNTSSIQFIGISGQDLLEACPTIIASTGAACHSSSVSRILCEEIGEEAARSSVRLSVGRETTKEQLDRAVSVMTKAFYSLTNK